MPWKANYTISDEIGLSDRSIVWPDHNRCCFNVVVDLSLASGPEGLLPSDLATGDSVFAVGGGLAGLLDVLTSHRIVATFAVPAAMVKIYPDAIEAVLKRGHEVAAEGLFHEDVSRLSREEERARMKAATSILSEAIGSRPAGWYDLPRHKDKFAVGAISPHTTTLLVEEGYTYFGNCPADDAPHYSVIDFATAQAIVAMPYYYHFDDQFFMMYPRQGSGLENPDFLFRNWRAEFAAQYKRGRFFNMTLHPGNVGWCNRLCLLDQFLDFVRSQPDVWNAVSRDCADYWISKFPAATHLKLEPSIWKDYPGSLS
jgi:peptidoglycan/xylan/chitin deacetylase (PgdA/CDA1 family)